MLAKMLRLTTVLAMALGLLAFPARAGEEQEPGGDDDIAKKLKELQPEEPEDGDDGAVPATPGAILDTRSFWRFRIVRETEEVISDAGAVKHVAEKTVRLPAETPADWARPDFDDGTWARMRGPMLRGSNNDEEWKLILMRGRFEVTDPARAGDLTLDLVFRGGAVVYLNGVEVARAGMPKGSLDLYAPAEAYPQDVYFDAKGKIIYPRNAKSDPDVKARLERRVRRLEGCRIPAARLRKGVNVLAVAINRAPTLERCFKRNHHDTWWGKISLDGIKLTAGPGAAVVSNAGPRAGVGFAVWNQSVVQKVRPSDYPDPFAPLGAVRIAAAGNGVFAGQVVVGDEKPIKGLKVAVSDLKGPGAIPASAVQIRYAVLAGAGGFFDSLEEVAPEEVAVQASTGRSIQPLWITVSVPADAKAGDYSGTVTVSAEGVEAVAVPLAVRVAAWKLPPPTEFTGCMDVIQSPESVAMAYDVPLWSEEHFRLLDKSFALLGALGNKTLFISCIRRTHFGNEQAMVRWVRDDEGELRPDFSIVEKYLDAAMKHMGKIPGVILLCWEPPYSQGHAHGAGTASRTRDKTILYTRYDPETKEYSPAQGPSWGTPESREFWKKLTDGIQPVLEKRGLKGSMLFGLIGDERPTKQAMDDICNGVPGARWAVHSHYYVEKWQGYDMGMRIALWGLKWSPADPEIGYSFGWSNPEWVSYYPREMSLTSTLTEHRAKLEAYMGGRRNKAPSVARGEGPRGLGRLGGDFWVVLKDGDGRPKGTLAGRYPESAWGQLNLNFGVPRLLGKGRSGAVATVRSEAFREAQQEVEARVYIEKALLDDNGPKLLGDDLLKRCREALDARIRVVNRASWYRGAGEAEAWFIGSDWQARTELLFALAAEVGARYGGKAPTPNLSSEPERK